MAHPESPEEAKQNMRDAIKSHIRGLGKDGLPLPEPQAISDE